MINEIHAALIYDILKFLQENKDFLNQDEAARKKLTNETELFPAEIEEYLASMTENDLIKDIQSVLDKNHHSKLSKALANFCVNQVPTQIESFDSKSAPAHKGRFGNQLHTFYSSAPEKQILEKIHTFVSEVYKSPFIVVQTPIRLDQSQKASIHKELVEAHPHSVPSFSVNKNLIGGLRVFVDGKTHDHSWISQINKLTSITNK